MLIEPYLSDHLAFKYQGTRFPHTRMMPPPIEADALPRVDLVICTHRHGDHMDPGTSPVLAQAHAGCRFVVPAAEAAFAAGVGLPADRLAGAEFGVPLQPLPDLDLILHPLPAAHEQFEQDGYDRHLPEVTSSPRTACGSVQRRLGALRGPWRSGSRAVARGGAVPGERA